MKYELKTEGFKPVDFLENHLVISEIIRITNLEESQIKNTFDDLMYGLNLFNHTKVNTTDYNKCIFILKRREEKLCVGFRNNRIIVGFDYKEYTKEDIEHDIFIADLEKKYEKMEA